MKTFLACLVLVYSITANASSKVSPEISRACAELMGDVVYFQVDNAAPSRKKIAALLDKIDNKAANGRNDGDVMATTLVRGVRKLLQSQVMSAPYDNVQYKDIVGTYEALVKVSRPEDGNNPGFVVLDLRYRYLSKTLATMDGWNIASVTLSRTLEESYDDTESAMKRLGSKKPGYSALRKWGTLRKIVLNYNKQPLPSLANHMTLSIANEIAGPAAPNMEISSH